MVPIVKIPILSEMQVELLRGAAQQIEESGKKIQGPNKTMTLTSFVIRPPPRVVPLAPIEEKAGNKNTEMQRKHKIKTDDWNALATKDYVMKLTSETSAMRELRTRHWVERKWPKSEKSWENFYVFPLESLRDMQEFPMPEQNHGKWHKIGLYMPYGGISWTRFFSEKMTYAKSLRMLTDEEYSKYEAMVTGIVTHLLESVDRLHKMDIVHNDIWAENLLIDEKFNVRLIDWERASFCTTNASESKRSWFECPISESCWTCALWQAMAWKETSWCDNCSNNKQGRTSQDWKRIVKLLRNTERCFMFPKIRTLLSWLSAKPTAETAQRWIKDVVQNIAFLSVD